MPKITFWSTIGSQIACYSLRIDIFSILEGGCFFMVFVKKAAGQSDDQLIRNFTKKVLEANIIQEAKDRRFHLNKQEKKKLIEQQARRMKRKAH